MTRKLNLSRETLRGLTDSESGAVAAGLWWTMRDSIEIRCFSKPVFQTTKIVGNTCIQD